jgi:hypothetical protein
MRHLVIFVSTTITHSGEDEESGDEEDASNGSNKGEN